MKGRKIRELANLSRQRCIQGHVSAWFHVGHAHLLEDRAGRIVRLLLGGRVLQILQTFRIIIEYRLTRQELLHDRRGLIRPNIDIEPAGIVASGPGSRNPHRAGPSLVLFVERLDALVQILGLLVRLGRGPRQGLGTGRGRGGGHSVAVGHRNGQQSRHKSRILWFRFGLRVDFDHERSRHNRIGGLAAVHH